MTPIPDDPGDVSQHAPYVPGEPRRRVDREALRARIPGWGADLDPADRPAVPRLRYDPAASGAHWEFPDRQPERWPRERSIEHAGLTPVFGTSCPPKGLSGVLRRQAYKKYSEARAAHWLILIAADRVDAWESHLASFLTLRPDNPITETGVLSEPARHGLSSRFGTKRADLSHQWLDPVVVAGPWVLTAGAGVAAIRAVLRRRS
ncbi:hypothetical protein GCM10011374_23960 [Kocuria dechangensis]|uniref:Uncharacterized protein n=1 Tax=Kocuria dechangensis TaxID=1176249 RepID=A0A917GXD8_9MICC|nr:hypothetical protein [Kocuria dechangensis]GGG60320.1 hypothetical protein GCM10011374_23960 [Kocuria dechangensis]